MNRKLKYYYANRDKINEKKREARIIDDVIKLRKELKARSLQDKIAKDTAQFNLREIYKPIIEGQKQQTQDITKSQKEISEAQVRQQEAIQDQRTQDSAQKHDLLIEEIKKQPLIIPLIKSLNKEPNVVKVIKGESDGSDLNGREQHILEQVNKVDDRILKTLIDFYSPTHYEEASEISKTESAIQRISDEQQIAQDKFEGIMSESGIGTSESSAVESTKYKLQMSASLRKQEEEGKGLYDYLMGLHTYADRQRKENAIRMLFIEREKKDNFIQYLNSINFNINLGKFPFTTIKSVNPDFYIEIQELKNQKIGTGINVKFLTSDPQELVKKLQILIAEKKAGNNNVFNEISAIVDELRRLGHLTIGQIKKIYKMIA